MEIQEKLHAENPSDEHVHHDLAATCGQISDAYRDLGDLSQAALYTQKEVEISQAFFEKEPTSGRYRRDMWASHFRLAQQCSIAGDENCAAENYRRALEFLEPLLSADAKDQGHQRWLAVTYSYFAGTLAKLGQGADALVRAEQAIQSEEVVGKDPERVESRRDLMKMYDVAGVLLMQANELERALDLFKRAETLAESLTQQDPQNARVRSAFAQLSGNMADCERSLAERPEVDAADRAAKLRAACQLYERSLAFWTEVKNRGMLKHLDIAKADAAARDAAECTTAVAASKP
jgi:tetratricopeptide (TPR) repeat protein